MENLGNIFFDRNIMNLNDIVCSFIWNKFFLVLLRIHIPFVYRVDTHKCIDRIKMSSFFSTDLLLLFFWQAPCLHF